MRGTKESSVLTEVPVEALRTLFLDDARSAPALERKTNRGLVDRAGNTWDIRSQEVHYRAEQRFSYGNIDLE